MITFNDLSRFHQVLALCLVCSIMLILQGCNGIFGPTVGNPDDNQDGEDPVDPPYVDPPYVDPIKESLGTNFFTFSLFNRPSFINNRNTLIERQEDDFKITTTAQIPQNEIDPVTKHFRLEYTDPANNDHVNEFRFFETSATTSNSIEVGRGLIFPYGLLVNFQAAFANDVKDKTGSDRNLEGFSGAIGKFLTWNKDNKPERHTRKRYGSLEANSGIAHNVGYFVDPVARSPFLGEPSSSSTLYRDVRFTMDLNYIQYDEASDTHTVELFVTGWHARSKGTTGSKDFSSVEYGVSSQEDGYFKSGEPIEFSLEINSAPTGGAFEPGSRNLQVGLFGSDFDSSFLAGTYFFRSTEHAESLSSGGNTSLIYWGAFALGLQPQP